MNFDQAFSIYKNISTSVNSIIKGKNSVVEKVLAAFFTGGHVLLEDAPGTGKTMLAKTLAKSVDSTFVRIQCTPDLLPGDILGVSIFNQETRHFELHKGPVFTNILLADEINRTSPRTQSALLESMAEKQVTIDGKRHALEESFFVIATQNPAESRGTYPIPESQMDRFMVKLSLGYASRDDEVEILNGSGFAEKLHQIRPVCTKEEISQLSRIIENIRISEELKYYIADITAASRNFPGVSQGAGTRASLALMRMSQSIAFFNKSEFVIPDYIQLVAENVLPHRIMLNSESKFSGITSESVVRKIIDSIPVPA